MSVIGRTPFIDKIVNNLDKSGVLSLASLLNNLGSATTVSLKSINDSNKGVSHVIFNLDELQNKNVEGILIYSDATHCGLFVFDTTSGNMYEYEINPTNKTYIQIYEHLTVEELRQICGDRLVEAGAIPFLENCAKVLYFHDGYDDNTLYDNAHNGDIIIDFSNHYILFIEDIDFFSDGKLEHLYLNGFKRSGKPIKIEYEGQDEVFTEQEIGTPRYLVDVRNLTMVIDDDYTLICPYFIFYTDTLITASNISEIINIFASSSSSTDLLVTSENTTNYVNMLRLDLDNQGIAKANIYKENLTNKTIVLDGLLGNVFDTLTGETWRLEF